MVNVRSILTVVCLLVPIPVEFTVYITVMVNMGYIDSDIACSC